MKLFNIIKTTLSKNTNPFQRNKNLVHDMDQLPEFSRTVLNIIMKTTGKYPAETGGILGSRDSDKVIDLCCFDKKSSNTSASFYYDIESMSKVMNKWRALGYEMNGIFHSHPDGCIRPSYHDIASALLHMDFLKKDYFYLPIIQREKHGNFKLHFYMTKIQNENVLVIQLGTIFANSKKYISKITNESTRVIESHSVWDLKRYQLRTGMISENNQDNKSTESTEIAAKEPAHNAALDNKEYFTKIDSMLPQNVLNKVIVCIGTGGARSMLENFARNGFNNFILIDKDTVSATNIATQSVYISEIGKNKVDVLKDKILDINPSANVLAINSFLDKNMSDKDFKNILEQIPNKESKDYLILGCTDNFYAQKRSSYLALKYGIPYLAAMMYQKGAAAEIIFVYPGVTPCCPRCLLRKRFEAYEDGYNNDVTSDQCTIFATERMNALKGYISLMLLSYNEDSSCQYSKMLDSIKDRNFIQIRLDNNLQENLGISLFDNALKPVNRYTFMDETLWLPQTPDDGTNGLSKCKLCNGIGDLTKLTDVWEDTRVIN